MECEPPPGCCFVEMFVTVHRETTLVVYVMAVIGMLSFSCALYAQNLLSLYSTSAFLGSVFSAFTFVSKRFLFSLLRSCEISLNFKIAARSNNSRIAKCTDIVAKKANNKNFKMLLFNRFFMNGYITVGYEFGAELTYPHAETTTSGLLNAAGELCGVVAVLVAGAVLEVCGSTATNLALTGT